MQQNSRALRISAAQRLAFKAVGEADRRRSTTPMSIDADQFGRILAAARAMDHRLLLLVLWQSGGRIGEVLGLRPCDINRQDGALMLLNEKQRRRKLSRKLVFVSRDLVAELEAFARGLHLRSTQPLFRSNSSGPSKAMSRCQAWRIVSDCSRRAAVLVPGQRGLLVPASPVNFRHGNAVHQLRQGVPLTEVQRQLGHARIESTLVYLQLTDPERRDLADRVEW